MQREHEASKERIRIQMEKAEKEKLEQEERIAQQEKEELEQKKKEDAEKESSEEPVVISEPKQPEVKVENVIHENNDEGQIQHGPDFSELQKAEVNLEPGVSYASEVNNPALTQLNQDPNLAIEAAISNIIGQNSALQNLDKSTLNLIVKNSIDTAIADIIKKNPELQHIDTEMLNATLREMAKSIPNPKENK
jgi:hypothetical protein